MGQIKERVTNLSARLATAHDQLVGAKKQRTEKRSVVDVNSKDLNEKVDVLQRVINIVSKRFDADGRVLLQGVSRTEPVMQSANTALLQEQWSSKEQPEGVVCTIETSHRFIGVLKKLLSDFSTQKQSLMTVEKTQVHASEVTREDLMDALASLKQSQAQAVAEAAVLHDQIVPLKVAIKDDKADKAVNLHSTSELEVDLKEPEDIFIANRKLREEEFAAQRPVLRIDSRRLAELVKCKRMEKAVLDERTIWKIWKMCGETV